MYDILPSLWQSWTDSRLVAYACNEGNANFADEKESRNLSRLWLRVHKNFRECRESFVVKNFFMFVRVRF